MNDEEKRAEIYKIYATLGELSVLKKQNKQRLELINKQIDEFEAKLVETIAVEVEEPKDE